MSANPPSWLPRPWPVGVGTSLAARLRTARTAATDVRESQPTVAPVRFTRRPVSAGPGRANRGGSGGARAFVASLPLDRRVAARVVEHRGGGATGTRDADLAARRAERVAELVRGDGLADVEIAVAPVGETAPVDPTWEGVAWTRSGGVSVTATSLGGDPAGLPRLVARPGLRPTKPAFEQSPVCAPTPTTSVLDGHDPGPRRAASWLPRTGPARPKRCSRTRTDKVKQLEADVIQLIAARSPASWRSYGRATWSGPSSRTTPPARLSTR